MKSTTIELLIDTTIFSLFFYPIFFSLQKKDNINYLSISEDSIQMEEFVNLLTICYYYYLIVLLVFIKIYNGL